MLCDLTASLETRSILVNKTMYIFKSYRYILNSRSKIRMGEKENDTKIEKHES